MLDFNPWLTMWTQPKKTIRKIVDFNPGFRLFVLSALYGIVSLVSLSQSFALGTIFNFFYILIFCLVLAPLWGYIIFSISAFFISLTGKWLKAKGNFRQVRCAIAWSNVPIVFNLLFWIILLIVFQSEILKDFPGELVLTKFQKSLLFFILLGQLTVSIWTLVLYVNALAEVQQFSIAKAILNIIIAVVLFVAIFFVISIFYFLLMKGVS